MSVGRTLTDKDAVAAALYKVFEPTFTRLAGGTLKPAA
jgi:hypothetical protein